MRISCYQWVATQAQAVGETPVGSSDWDAVITDFLKSSGSLLCCQSFRDTLVGQTNEFEVNWHTHSIFNLTHCSGSQQLADALSLISRTRTVNEAECRHSDNIMMVKVFYASDCTGSNIQQTTVWVRCSCSWPRSVKAANALECWRKPSGMYTCN